MTTDTRNPTERMKIRVQFLERVDGTPSAEWPVISTKVMDYSAYFELPTAELALTRVKFSIETDTKEDTP